jgi:hypothetical protein
MNSRFYQKLKSRPPDRNVKTLGCVGAESGN